MFRRIRNRLSRILRDESPPERGGPGQSAAKKKSAQRKNPARKAESPDGIGEGSEVKGKVERARPGGKIEIGDHCLVEGLLKTESESARISLADNVYVGGGTILSCAESIVVESDVLISYMVLIMDSDSHSLRYSVRKKDLDDWKNGNQHDWSTTAKEEVRICHGAWIGARSTILKGVRIGEGAVVGAASVVTRDVPDWTVVAGNPARVVKELGPDER